jgi:hypothetical protein
LTSLPLQGNIFFAFATFGTGLSSTSLFSTPALMFLKLRFCLLSLSSNDSYIIVFYAVSLPPVLYDSLRLL